MVTMSPLKFIFAVCLSVMVVETVSLRLHKSQKGPKCAHQFNCGKILINLRYPFRVEGDPQGCGHSDQFQLFCEQNRTVLYLPPNSSKYYVAEESISNYRRHQTSIRVIDPGVLSNNCSSLPLHSIPPYFYDINFKPASGTDSLVFVTCKKPADSLLYVDTAPCVTAKEFSNQDSAESDYSYVVVPKAGALTASNIKETCTIHRITILGIQYSRDVMRRSNISFRDIHDAMASGFELEWDFGFCKNSNSMFACYIVSYIPTCVLIGGQLLPPIVGARAIVGSILFFAFLIYKCRRRHLSMYDAIEDYLQSRNNLIPIRYSYKQIKNMTNNFKEKLGEGGYGCVYKGKLRSGQLVAVKMLSKSKANGQEFINEVASLGTIHHVNVVRLVGFCVTVSKRALVYDYMPNGSLEKFIFLEHPNRHPLSWKEAFEIAVGVARGIEYLHQGCNMQILHFDIKPHNILLDDNFVPKISDFGLAKLHPVQNSVVTLTAIRGTLGYMAPELFYKRIGKVSCKADVYSFGMLLLEMSGRRRNVNAHVEHSSQIYFPSWIYDKVDQGGDVEIEDATEDENRIVRKLILIAFWCIQMTPNDRPSIREVLEMLQGDLERVKLPPKPLFYPPDSPPPAQSYSYCSTYEESTTTPCNSESLEETV